MAAQRRGRGGKMLRKGHRKRVWGVAVSPDGSTLASVDQGGVLCVGPLWQAEPTHTIQAYASFATSVCWQGDALIGVGGVLALGRWDARTGAQVDARELTAGGAVHDVVATRGAIVASTQRGEGWRWVPGEEPSALGVGSMSRMASLEELLVFAGPGGEVIARGDDDAERWRLAPGGAVSALAVSRDGERVAVGVRGEVSGDSVVRVYSAAGGALLYEYGGFSSRVCALAFSPGGEWLAVGVDSSAARMLRAADGEDVTEAFGDLPVAMDLALTDDTLVIAESMTSKVRLYDLLRFLG